MSEPDASLPVVAVCGFKNSGKTTLIEGLVPILRDEGLVVAVIKHDTHGLQIDHEGKDSDRLFKSGADVMVRGPNESLTRLHPWSDRGLDRSLAALLENHDLVLVEGHKEMPLPKIWLHGRGQEQPPVDVGAIELELAWGANRIAAATGWIRQRLAAVWRHREVRGVVLIGGASRRMGKPKQIMRHGGITMAERAVEAMRPQVEQVVLAGSGPVPDEIRDLHRLPDVPEVAGPLAGLLSAMRWAPESAWVVAACDMPRIEGEAVRWLLEQRRLGTWAVLPRSRSGKIEALLAVYEPQSRPLLEAQAAAGRWGPRHLAENERVLCPTLPAELAEAWTNVNTPEEIRDSLHSHV